ncbi:hypothetical protein FTX45_19375 [Leclercia adecarboxylata]|nr:hypothetical protein FTX45_19375 [Leclercia adecarboxylata]
MLGESDLTHSDLLRGHNQYVGRSLKVNGSFFRDTYTNMMPLKGSKRSCPLWQARHDFIWLARSNAGNEIPVKGQDGKSFIHSALNQPCPALSSSGGNQLLAGSIIKT